MEMSTITLSVLRADFFTPTMQLMSQACFALSFFFFRILLSPFLYYQIVSTMYNARTQSVQTDGWCFPEYLYYASLIFGGFFNCLNFFCTFHLSNLFPTTVVYLANGEPVLLTALLNFLFVSVIFTVGFTKLMKKIKRKLRGQESLEMKEKLDD